MQHRAGQDRAARERNGGMAQVVRVVQAVQEHRGISPALSQDKDNETLTARAEAPVMVAGQRE
jgi:hypothetical protein